MNSISDEEHRGFDAQPLRETHIVNVDRAWDFVLRCPPATSVQELERLVGAHGKFQCALTDVASFSATSAVLLNGRLVVHIGAAQKLGEGFFYLSLHHARNALLEFQMIHPMHYRDTLTRICQSDEPYWPPRTLADARKCMIEEILSYLILKEDVVLLMEGRKEDLSDSVPIMRILADLRVDVDTSRAAQARLEVVLERMRDFNHKAREGRFASAWANEYADLRIEATALELVRDKLCSLETQ